MNTKQYTVLDGDRRFKQTDWGSAPLPGCQAHLMSTRSLEGPCSLPGEFDSPTKNGPWADLCRTHAAVFCPEHSTIGFHRVRKV